MLANWQRQYTMEDILLQLKKEMLSPQNRKLAQPPEGVLIIFFSVIVNVFPFVIYVIVISTFIVNLQVDVLIQVMHMDCFCHHWLYSMLLDVKLLC